MTAPTPLRSALLPLVLSHQKKHTISLIQTIKQKDILMLLNLIKKGTTPNVTLFFGGCYTFVVLVDFVLHGWKPEKNRADSFHGPERLAQTGEGTHSISKLYNNQSERHFTFNEKLADKKNMYRLNHSRKRKNFKASLSGPSVERLWRAWGLSWVSPSTSTNNVALGTSFHKQTPSLLLAP